MFSVKVSNACKSYGKGENKVDILKEMNLHVETGSIYVLLGASGCGKTTLLSSIMGTQALDEGEIIVLGEKIQSNKTPKCCLHLGLMPQDNLLCDEFTIEETLDFFGNIYQMDKDILEERKDLLKNLLELPCDSQRIVDCSGGQKRRISLAAAMIHNPKLLILDEPTVGLDPILRVKIWDLLKKSTKDHNMSIIITSHYIEEARNADRCGLMRNGSLLEEDDPENILKKYNCETLEDAFLKLCTNQKEGIQSNIKSKNCQMTNFEFQERKYFHKKTMKALFGKSFVKVKRDPFLTIFTGFLFLSLTILISNVFGKFPNDLKFGIVNGEITSLNDCRNSSFSKIEWQKDSNSCKIQKISCLFINEVNTLGQTVFYQNYENAYKDGKQANFVALITFSSNFSFSTEKLLEQDQYHENEDELLEDREINIHIDQRNFYFASHYQQTLYDIYQNYTNNLSKYCNISSRINQAPIQFNTPIYGKKDTNNFLNCIGPYMNLLSYLFSFLTVTVVVFIDERKKGLWSRTFMSGVEASEMLIAHSTIYTILGVFHLFTYIPITRYYYHVTQEIHLALLVTYYIIFYMTGVLLGLLMGIIFNNYVAASLLLVFGASTFFLFSGIIWPFESLDIVMFYIMKYLIPTNISAFGFSDMITRGFGIKDLSVQLGIFVLIGWNALFLLSTLILINKSKFK